MDLQQHIEKDLTILNQILEIINKIENNSSESLLLRGKSNPFAALLEGDEIGKISDKRNIFNWLKSTQFFYPKPNDLPPIQFYSTIFRVLDFAVEQILTYFKKQQSAKKIKASLNKTLISIITHIKKDGFSLVKDNLIEKETIKNIFYVIDNIALRSLDKEIKRIWNQFKLEYKQVNILINELNQLFADNGYYEEIEEQNNPIKIIKREDIKLVCYEWFKPE